MKVQDTGRAEFLQRVADGDWCTPRVLYLVPSLAEGQNPPPPEPADTSGRLRLCRHASRRAAGRGRRVFAPDGQHPVAGVVVYAYNTDRTATIRQTASRPSAAEGLHEDRCRGSLRVVYHPPGTLPRYAHPAHVHFNLWGAGYPVQWTEELRFEAIRI